MKGCDKGTNMVVKFLYFNWNGGNIYGIPVDGEKLSNLLFSLEHYFYFIFVAREI